MATYKVIQDIEADDKLLGPLTLRQFVYAGVTVFCLYLSYFAISQGLAFLLVIFLPPALLAGFFAFPWGKEQPTELWALARIRFIFKPRKRIWNQTGIKELVTITAPKRIEKIYTNGLSQTEVKSRLQALATTIDSRGWAIKSAAMSPYTATPVLVGMGSDNSERLIDPGSLAQNVPMDDTTPYDDMLDSTNNPKAQQFDTMLEQNAQTQRDRLMTQMQQTATNTISQQTPSPTPPSADYWFLNQQQGQTIPADNTTFGSQVVTPGTVPNSQIGTSSAIDEQALVEQLRNNTVDQTMQYSHLPTILPLAEQEKQAKQAAAQASIPTDDRQDAVAANDTKAAPPVTPEPDAAILELAHKDDWNISTIARQAKKAHGEENPDEVVISLH